MAKSVVVNKLNLGKDTVGYRVDIVDMYRTKIVSVDISENRIKPFLKMVGSVKVSKGVIIPGKLVNGLFVTGNDDNIVEVRPKAQADEILNKYFFNSDEEVKNILDGIDCTEEELIRKNITGHVDTLVGTSFGVYRKVQNDYNTMMKALKGFKYNLYVEENQDRNSGDLQISADLATRNEALKVYYNFEKAMGRDKIKVQLYTEDSSYVPLSFNLNEPFEKFASTINKRIGSTDIELVGDYTNCYVSSNGCHVVLYRRDIPGYETMKYAEDVNAILKEYDLV